MSDIEFTAAEFAFLAKELRDNGDHAPAYKALLSNNYNVILAALDKAASHPSEAGESSNTTTQDEGRSTLVKKLETMDGRQLTLFLGMGEFKEGTTDAEKRRAILSFFYPAEGSEL